MTVLDLAFPALGHARDKWRRVWLRVRPPVDRPEFWATQLLVLVVAGAHAVLEVLPMGLKPLEFVPVSLFLIPAVYAALNFGLRGAAATVVWCAIVTVPNVVLFHGSLERVGEILQVVFVVAVGLLVGNRIDREQRARADAERRELERQESELRYRALFEATGDATVVLDPVGMIEDANEAAGRLFGARPSGLHGQALRSVVGHEVAEALLAPAPSSRVRLNGSDGVEIWAEPVVSSVDSGRGHIQIVLHDVTHQQRREEGLQAYAHQTLATREEERRRVARELHDGPLQSLVLLWRRLDTLEQAVPAEAQQQVVETRRLAEEIAADLRRFSRSLRPSVLDDLGLGPALRAECTAFSGRTQIPVHYRENANLRQLPVQAQVMILRIVPEALHNIERHSGASAARVTAAQGRDAVRVTISDNGCGFEPGNTTVFMTRGKLGLLGMQERATLAGGQLRIAAAPGRGTRLVVTIPAAAGHRRRARG